MVSQHLGKEKVKIFRTPGIIAASRWYFCARAVVGKLW